MFRSRKVKCSFSKAKPVVEKQYRIATEQDDRGNIIQRVEYLDVDIADPEYSKNMPRPEEYTLENLLAAGIPLDQINVNGLLAKSDVNRFEAVTNLPDEVIDQILGTDTDIQNKDK